MVPSLQSSLALMSGNEMSKFKTFFESILPQDSFTLANTLIRTSFEEVAAAAWIESRQYILRNS